MMPVRLNRFRPRALNGHPKSPASSGGWALIVFMIFILIMLSRCSDHHESATSPGYLPPMAPPPDDAPSVPGQDTSGDAGVIPGPQGDGNNFSFVPSPQVVPAPTSRQMGSVGVDNQSSSWYVPREEVGAGNNPPLSSSSPPAAVSQEDREPAWIIPREDNQRAQ